MYATIRRYEGVDVTRTSEVVGKVNETLMPQLRNLPALPATTSSKPERRSELARSLRDL
jgi:hypothetical protein